MYNFEYDIKEDEETGSLFVDLPKTYSNQPEHSFMAMQITLYRLNELVVHYSNTLEDDDKKNKEIKLFLNKLVTSAEVISLISSKYSEILKGQNNALEEFKNILNTDDDSSENNNKKE